MKVNKLFNCSRVQSIWSYIKNDFHEIDIKPDYYGLQRMWFQICYSNSFVSNRVTKSVYIVTLEEEIISAFKRWALLISAKLETLATSCSAHYDVQIKSIWLFVIFSNLEQRNALGGGGDLEL